MHVGRRLWLFCHTLRHDGIDYGQYLDQLTYLLFLKMADEKRIEVLPSSNWATLRATSDAKLLGTYSTILERLASTNGMVGDIYQGSTSEFSRINSLRKIIDLLDEINWADLDTDVQADAFEYLLEQAASEGKKGAGQYFTPRDLIKVIVDCVQPGALSSDLVISDPATGTGGFLVAAAQWAGASRSASAETGAMTFTGVELVPRARRLALMNLMLHRVELPQIELGDSITDPPRQTKSNVILTNPPFGSKGGPAPRRADFWFTTTNKQLNFVQHIVNELAPAGRAAVILPDNCFFGDAARQLWPRLTERCDVHTILRLPPGTFAPYTAGTRTNVVFLTKGKSTDETWTYDARTDMPLIGSANPLKEFMLSDFRNCFGRDPHGKARRDERDSKEGRWNRFSVGEMNRASFQIDQLAWRRTTTISPTRQAPSSLLRDVLDELNLAVDEVKLAIEELSEHA